MMIHRIRDIPNHEVGSKPRGVLVIRLRGGLVGMGGRLSAGHDFFFFFFFMVNVVEARRPVVVVQ